jgi:hypothetical protein
MTGGQASAAFQSADRGSGLIEIRELVAMLRARMPALAAELLPHGRQHGAEWRCGDLAGEPGQSLGVHLRGAKAGWWKDFASGQGGDPLDLIAEVMFRGDRAPAVRWAKGWLGLESMDPATLAKARKAAQRIAVEAERQQQVDRARKQRAARGLWLSARPVQAGDLVARYLDQRGISLARLGRVPGALRCADSVLISETAAMGPAMLAAVLDGAGAQIATHRTFLDPATATKAALTAPKKVLGEFSGGYIPIWKGADRSPLHQLPSGRRVIVAEGIEDALSVALALPAERIIAAVSLANIALLPLRPGTGPVLIAGQHDAPGSPAAALTDSVMARLRARGFTVGRALPPAGCKDWNDYVRGGAGG